MAVIRTRMELALLRQRLLLAFCLACASAGAMAAGAGLRAGTTGIGGDIAVEVLPTLSARVGYSSYLSFSTTVDSSDVEYDARPKLSNGNLFLDWSPLGPFRITGGLILNSNKIDVTAVPTGGTLTINGVVYPAASIGAACRARSSRASRRRLISASATATCREPGSTSTSTSA